MASIFRLLSEFLPSDMKLLNEGLWWGRLSGLHIHKAVCLTAAV